MCMLCTGSWLSFQVGCDASCLRVVSVLLRDLLAADSMAYHHAHVVIVVPQEPTLAWDALLCLQPSFTVTYLNGDLRCISFLWPRMMFALVWSVCSGTSWC